MAKLCLISKGKALRGAQTRANPGYGFMAKSSQNALCSTDSAPAERYEHILLQIAEEFGSFSKYAWMFVGFKPIVNLPHLFTQELQVRRFTQGSDAQRIRVRGADYYIVVYRIQAAGLVKDHLTGCLEHSQCSTSSIAQTFISSSTSPARFCTSG
ncbi:hypothetical protein R1sor_005819 [Riccia sorocarpa]|uniref:Uncharacterized protein n=1 Tax=Riccia sorocarpa TaxID=122646 RepID=A0ABD3HL68_9MARC